MYKLKNKKYILFLSVIVVGMLLLFAVYTVTAEREDDEHEGLYERESYQEREIRDDDYYESLPTVSPSSNSDLAPNATAQATTDTAVLNELLNSLKDTDQDGIIDGEDQHPGEDDFAYVMIDKNNNGIADDLEVLQP